jgi:hypothetical protein
LIQILLFINILIQLFIWIVVSILILKFYIIIFLIILIWLIIVLILFIWIYLISIILFKIKLIIFFLFNINFIKLIDILLITKKLSIDLLITFVKTFEPKLVLRTLTNPLRYFLGHTLEFDICTRFKDFPWCIAEILNSSTQIYDFVIVSLRYETHKRVEYIVYRQGFILILIILYKFTVLVQPRN